MPYQIEIRKLAFTASHIHCLLPMPHIHSHLELIYLTKGKSVATLDNKEYVIEAGDLFLSFPNQIHFYHDQEPVEGYLIIFSLELFKELREGFQSKVPKHPVLHKDELPLDIVDRMEKIYKKLKSTTSFDEVAARGYLLALLGEVLPVMTLMDNPGEQDTIKRILTYCIENYTQPLTLEYLSKELYLNKYYISHVFQERMNISYKDFINNLRVERACELLEKGTSITEIAYASGFSSVRTFNRAFLKRLGVAPREYMKQKEK